MRRAFVRTLADLGERDDRITLLTGDLGFTVVEPFAERFPHRFFNVGVAEQNMLGVATGLAEAGYIPFVYSIATFATLRAYEFIRNGPVLHDLPVRIVGVGGGFEYGSAGPTHHALEDLSLMRVLPGLAVIAPADHCQATAALRSTWNRSGPIYYRLGKDETSTVQGLEGRFELGSVAEVRPGDDVAIVAVGPIANEAVEAAVELQRTGIQAAVFVAATLNPSPADELEKKLRAFPLIVSIETHRRTGGLGSVISEVIAERGLGARLLRLGVGESWSTSGGGSENFLLRQNGLTADLVADRVRTAIGIGQ